MSMAIPTLPSPNFSLKPSLLSLKFTPFSRLSAQNRIHSIPSRYFPITIQSFNLKPTHNGLGFVFCRNLGFFVNAENGNGGESNTGGGGGGGVDDAEKLARGESTMPDRFRHLTKEAPDPPVRWPWFIAMAFLVYAWRAVLLELSNWRNAVVGIVHFVAYLLKLALALIFYFIGDPITSLIRCIETIIYSIRAFYSGIVAYAPVPELSVIILLASAVLAIAEATVPNSVSSQPHLLTLSGIIGYAAVRGYISEPFFWTLLLGLYGFSRLVKKKDDVSSALPVAAVLAAIGEPWVRVLAMASYFALAISHHSKKLSKGQEEGEVVVTERRLPLPLLGAALAIGIHVAAKWAGYRHLTWMIV